MPPAGPPAGREDIRVGDGRLHVEWQHACPKILQEHGLGRSFEDEAGRPSGMIAMPERISAWHTDAVNSSSAGCPDIKAATSGAGDGAIMADRMLVSRTNISRSGAVRGRVRAGAAPV